MNEQIHEGEVACYLPDRGFGFIRADGRQKDVYFSVRAVRPEEYLPAKGDFVRFSVGVDRSGRPAATAV
jgi:cold shock CspA family protein